MKMISLSDDDKSNANSEVQIIQTIHQKGSSNPGGTPGKSQPQSIHDKSSDIIMIDIDSDHTQSNNKKSSPLKNNSVEALSVGDDEWMSDDNIDAKMDIIRKQFRNKQ